MSIWFVVPLEKEAEFREAFDSVVDGEVVGSLIPESDEIRGFTGSHKATPEEAAEIVAMVDGVSAFENWPPPGGWVNYPMQNEE